jgi:hypothetical protein
MSAGLIKPHGHVVITDDMGRQTTQDTHCCCHCGGHWIHTPGSGRPHKFCTNCNGLTCSKKECIENCVHREKQLELIERNWARMNQSW